MWLRVICVLWLLQGCQPDVQGLAQSPCTGRACAPSAPADWMCTDGYADELSVTGSYGAERACNPPDSPAPVNVTHRIAWGQTAMSSQANSLDVSAIIAAGESRNAHYRMEAVIHP